MPTILKFLLSPVSVSRSLQRHPHWIGAFLILVSLWVLITFLEHPALVHATLERLPPSATAADRVAAAEYLDVSLPLRLTFLPIRLLLGWGTFAGLLWGAGRAFVPAGGASFSHFMSLEVHAEATLVISRALESLFLITRLFSPGSAPLSLDSVFGSTDNPLVTFLLRSTNLFTLWYISLLVGGVVVLLRCRVRTAILLVVGVWLVALGASLGGIVLLRDLFHFMLTP